MTTEQTTPSGYDERSRADVVEGTLVQPAVPVAHTAAANPAPFAPAATDPGVSDTAAGWGTPPAQRPGGWSLRAVVIALTITALVAGGGGFLAGQAFGGGGSSTGTTQQGPGGGQFPDGGGFPGGGQQGGQQGGFPGGGGFPGQDGGSTEDGATRQDGTADSGQEATA